MSFSIIMIRVEKIMVVSVQIYTHTFYSKCDNYLCPISLKTLFHALKRWFSSYEADISCRGPSQNPYWCLISISNSISRLFDALFHSPQAPTHIPTCRKTCIYIIKMNNNKIF